MDAPPTPDLSRLWAIVPIRGLETAKTRLGGELDPEERLALVTEMLRRTLAATRDASSIARTIVVTMDPAAAGMAGRHGAIGLVERVPGLNEAIRAARSVAVARDASATLVLPADLPRITSDALVDLVGAAASAEDAVLAQAAARVPAAGGLVLLVPDRHGEGTNALLTWPPEVIDPAFGPGSRAAHRAAAVAAGAAYVEWGGPLAFDVDTAADLLLAEAVLGSRGA